MRALLIAASTAALLGAGAAQTPDRLEPGKQGETLPGEATVLPVPYSKGINVIGHSDVWKRGGNVVLAAVDHCAYISSGGSQNLESILPGVAGKDPAQEGVAVVDVSNPKAPKAVKLLRDKGSIHAAETISAISAPGREVLVAGDYGGGKPDKPDRPAWLSIYDASTCAAPKLMAEIKWPENAHMVTLSPDGKHVYGTIIDPFTSKGGVQVMDISDMAHPRFVGKFGATRADGSRFEFAAHEVAISPDEKRLYVGIIGSTGGDLNQDFKSKSFGPQSVGPEAGGFYIFDNGDLVAGRASPRLKLIGTAQHAGWHSPARANIGDVPYIINAGELGACPGAWPRITNIADEKSPRIIGEFRLAMNKPENCPERTAIEKATGGIVGRPGIAASHFQDVDSATHTRLGLFPMMWAGLRIADLRDPANPTEIAYFKPGDICMSHVHYAAKSGQIWFSCTASGFWVIALKPEVTAKLGGR
jgi:hypothetical protein